MNRVSETYGIPSNVPTYIAGVLEKRRDKKEAQRIFQEIVASNFPNLTKKTLIYITEKLNKLQVG